MQVNTTRESCDTKFEAGAADKLVGFLAKCQEVVKHSATEPIHIHAVVSRPAAGIVNREREAARVVSFIDEPTYNLCQILGLEQIGKSTVLEKAIAQAGMPTQACRIVRLKEESTAEYLLASIIRGHDIGTLPSQFKLEELLENVSAAVRRYRLIVIEDAHTMLQGGQFRSTQIRQAIKHLMIAVEGSKCKLIVLSRRSMPDDLTDPSRNRKVWVQGLNGAKVADGILDQEIEIKTCQHIPTRC